MMQSTALGRPRREVGFGVALIPRIPMWFYPLIDGHFQHFTCDFF